MSHSHLRTCHVREDLSQCVAGFVWEVGLWSVKDHLYSETRSKVCDPLNVLPPQISLKIPFQKDHRFAYSHFVPCTRL